MSAPRAQQVLKQQIAQLPERYPAYRTDAVKILNDELRAIGDSEDKARRRKNLVDSIKAKATQMPAPERD